MKENKQPFWKSAEFWISISATIIALASLVFTITESRRGREHDRRSSVPRLGVTFWYKEDSAGFSMGNMGLGPGRLEWLQVLVDGKSQPDWRNMLKQLGFSPVPTYGFIVPAKGHWWSPEDKREIFIIKNQPNLIRMKQESGRIELKGCYCSIYEQCWIFSRSSLKPVEVSRREAIPEITLNAPPPMRRQ